MTFTSDLYRVRVILLHAIVSVIKQYATNLLSKCAATFYITVIRLILRQAITLSALAINASRGYKEDCVQRRDMLLPDNTTCTDKLQQWHILPKGTINPAPVSDIELRKAEYGKEEENRPKLTFPRHPSDRTLNPEHVSTLLDKLKSTCTMSGVPSVLESFRRVNTDIH